MMSKKEIRLVVMRENGAEREKSLRIWTKKASNSRVHNDKQSLIVLVRKLMREKTRPREKHGQKRPMFL